MIDISLRERFGKNKKNRRMGLGEAASLSSNTSFRMEDKGKSVVTEGTSTDATTNEALWDRIRLLEQAMLANGINVDEYINNGASTSATPHPPPPPPQNITGTPTPIITPTTTPPSASSRQSLRTQEAIGDFYRKKKKSSNLPRNP